MEGDDIDDMHMCLVCQNTVVGLINYVNHKKYDCPGRKGAISTTSSNNSHLETPVSSKSNDTHFTLPSTSIMNQPFLNTSSNLKESPAFHDLNSPNVKLDGDHNINHGIQSPPSTTTASTYSNSVISVDVQDSFQNFVSVGFSPGTSHGVDPNIVMNGKQGYEKSEDFFSSLALQSKSNAKDIPNQQNSEHSLFKTSFDKEGNSYTVENELPITNILNSINFSDDDLDFDEDLLEEAFSDDSADDIPSSDYAQGKWRPGNGSGRPRESGEKWHLGQRPYHTGGKWKPGQGPVGGKWKSHSVRSSQEASGKRQMGRTAGKGKEPVSRGKNIRITEADGEFLCKPCGKYFRNRFCYSSHFGTRAHKRNVRKSKYSDESSGSDTEVDESLLVNDEFKTGNSDTHGEGKEDSCSNNEQHCKENEIEDSLTNTYGSYFCKTCGIASLNLYSYDIHRQSELHISNTQNCQSKETSLTSKTAVQSVVPGNLEPVFNTDTAEKVVEPRRERNNTNVKKLHANVVENEVQHLSEMRAEIEKTAIDLQVIKMQQEAPKEMCETTEKKEEKPSLQEEKPSAIFCKICDKKFYSKYVMTRHLLSRSHRSRIQGTSDNLAILTHYHKYIVRLSPFQCSPCQFYFNTELDLKNHLHSNQHVKQLETMAAEIICSLCNFSSHSNDEIIKHFQENFLHKSLVKKSKKLCIMKEKNFQAKCRYCSKKMHSRVHMKRHLRYKHMMDTDSKGRISGEFQKYPCGKFQCKEDGCEKKFMSYNSYIIHVNRKHNTEAAAVYCKVCEKILSDRYSYGRHCVGNMHKRNLRKRKFAMKENLIKKEDNVNNEQVENEIRNRLQEQLVDNRSIRRYVRRKKEKMNVESKIFKCDYCDFNVSVYADLRPHYMEAHSSHILVCDVCDLTFLNEKALKLHTSSRQHQANLEDIEGVVGEKKIFSCEICKKRFTDEAMKQWHIDVKHLHPNSEEALRRELGKPDVTSIKYKTFLAEVNELDRGERLCCIECKKGLKKESILEHLRLHTGDKPFVCRYCKGRFMSALSLRRHLMSHLGLTERKCEICGKEFKKLESYKEHMKCHEMEKIGAQKLICEVCAMEFYLPKQLRAHMRRHGEKKFKCQIENCHWIFHFANELDAHMKTHTNARPYLCDVCGYAAGTRNRLNRHNRTHTGERNYHCDYCTYKAGTATHLRRHMRIHIGTKPYKCPYCSYSCNTHENIRKHIMKTKKHQGMFIYNCKSCKFGSNTVNDFRTHLQMNHPDQYELSRSMEGLACLTGLYIKTEDISKPTEGMKINPVKERNIGGGRTANKNAKKAKEVRDEVDQNFIGINPLYIHEEIVPNYEEGGYNNYRLAQNSSQPLPSNQIELDQAVNVVQNDSQDYDRQRSYEASVENVMLLDSSLRRPGDQQINNELLQKLNCATNSSIPHLLQPNFIEYKAQNL